MNFQVGDVIRSTSQILEFRVRLVLDTDENCYISIPIHMNSYIDKLGHLYINNGYELYTDIFTE